MIFTIELGDGSAIAPTLPSGTCWSSFMVESSSDDFERTRGLKKPRLERSCGTDSSCGERRGKMTLQRGWAEDKEGT